MAQWLGALGALTEDPGSVPGAHMAAHGRVPGDPTPSSGLVGMVHKYTHKQNMGRHRIKK